MRLYTEEEFKKELRAYGLKPTKSHSKGYRLWETEDGSLSFMIEENLSSYPESMLDRILERLGRLYHKPGEYH